MVSLRKSDGFCRPSYTHVLSSEHQFCWLEKNSIPLGIDLHYRMNNTLNSIIKYCTGEALGANGEQTIEKRILKDNNVTDSLK